jgi:hypothetical protein
MADRRERESVQIDKETHHNLGRLADHNGLFMNQQIRELVKKEMSQLGLKYKKLEALA